MREIIYDAPPTVARMMTSPAFGRVIAGPVGSGKTTGCVFEVFRRTCEQRPAADGYRYTRFAIVRQTLRQLKDTVLKDIESWLAGMVDYRVSENVIRLEVEDLRSEWMMIPLEDSEDQARVLSAQLTGVWISELIETDISILAPLSGRCGRYPRGPRGTPTWSGIIADTNMPTIGSDWHHFMTDETPPDWTMFFQPGGLDPGAENLEWLAQTDESMLWARDDPRRKALGRTYYERLARSNNPAWIKRYVDAQFGEDPSGTAVFRESFRMGVHVVGVQGGASYVGPPKDGNPNSPPEYIGLEPVQGLPLLIGQDFGRDPWSLICQLDHMGRLLVLEEVEGTGIGLELHVDRNLRPRLSQLRYLGKPIGMVGDPSGRNKDSIYEETSFDALKRMGFAAFPASTNDIDARVRAVDAHLMRSVAGKPALLIDGRRCPKLVAGMNGGYRYANTRAGIRKTTPEKNEFSHVADCLQYVALATHGGMVPMITRSLRKPVWTRQRPSAEAWT
jgi:hypothetical protein